MKPGGLVGAILLSLFVLAALVGPLVVPHSAMIGNLELRMLGPSLSHPLGPDEHGVDLLAAVFSGARLALFLGTVTVLICATTGVLIGTVAGYFGGIVDEVLMRVVDILLAFPGILLNLAIVSVVRRPGVGTLIFAMIVNGWVGYARVVRGQALSLRERDYVLAARATGAGPWRIMVRHVIPNLLAPVLVQMTFGFGGVILIEASLSFMGLGPQLSYSLGSLLDQGTSQLWHTHRLATVPGMAILIAVLGCNLLGDHLRDRLDPRR